MEQKSDKNIHMCHYIYKEKQAKLIYTKKDRTVNTPGKCDVRKGGQRKLLEKSKILFLGLSADYSVFHL